jgi:hypothetical protein
MRNLQLTPAGMPSCFEQGSSLMPLLVKCTIPKQHTSGTQCYILQGNGGDTDVTMLHLSLCLSHTHTTGLGHQFFSTLIQF